MKISKAIEVFEAQGGILRTFEARQLGIHSRTLRQLREEGLVEQLSRGVYRLSSLPPLTNPDLVTVALRIPRAVVCLVSALSYHDATSEVPHTVHIALPRNTNTPALRFPPIQVCRFSGASLTEGVERVQIDDVTVQIFNLPKTVVDCFRLRNKIGTEVAVEALQQATRRKGVSPTEILHYARLCRIERVILPYLESL
jgi:predicted transcriptional regulator of viral defense system